MNKKQKQLETITRKEADKRVFKDIKNCIRNAAFDVLITGCSGYVAANSPKGVVKVISGINAVLNGGLGIYNVASAYFTVRDYLNNPSKYVKKVYSKELVNK